MDKIKLVYNWIGPRGPIWNTELPNVLNFAEVAEGVSHLNSSKYFNDDLVKFFECYNHTSDYEIYPSVSIHSEDYRPYILPFTLSWRVPFERYFTGTEGILEYSHTPFTVINFIRHRNGYILINHGLEAFMEFGYIDALHSYFDKVHNIPLYKIIYLTGCMNAEEEYEKYCNDRNIPNDRNNRLTIVSHPISFTSFACDPSVDEPNYDSNIVPNKLFLMWNRRFRRHRVELSLNLEKLNLVDRSLISFDNEDPDLPGKLITDRFDRHRLVHEFNISEDIINRFISRLPLVLDGEENTMQMCQDYENKTRPYYQQSLISIVTETNFYESTASLTEKSFKPAKEKHPFIIAGVNGVLKKMRELGFKTFSEFWDESYDDITDSTERMHKIMQIMEYIGSWNQEQILDFRRKVEPILIHNYHVVRTASTKPTVDRITQLIKSNL